MLLTRSNISSRDAGLWLRLTILALGMVSLGVSAYADSLPCKPTSTALTTPADFSSGKLRGVTLMDLRSDGTTPNPDKDFVDLAATGANLVRLFMHAERCATCASYSYPAQEVAQAKRILRLGDCLGFKVVVSLNSKPGFAKAEFWTNNSLQDSLVQVWIELARALKDDPGIAAYDLINEPVPPRDAFSRGPNSAWRALASRMIEGIRSVDRSHVIVFEPDPWALPSGFKDLVPLPYDNLVYSFHFYEPRDFTHQGLYGNKLGVMYPSNSWNKARLSSLLDPVRSFAQRYDAKIYVGEFSAVRWAPDGSAAAYLKDAIELFEQAKWAWTYHVWRGYQGWDAEVPSDIPDIQSRGFLPEDRRSDTRRMKLLAQYFSLNR